MCILIIIIISSCSSSSGMCVTTIIISRYIIITIRLDRRRGGDGVQRLLGEHLGLGGGHREPASYHVLVDYICVL